MVDKNLFMYDLAVVAIFKDEGKYLKEWLDYHLLAGVEHFYLYNNDSSDDYAQVLAPYVEKNLVTLTDFPGKLMQYTAYHDAIEKYRFDCRYMAFIDIDEFIFPKSNRAVAEVVDEILSDIPNVAGLAINWQIFGSNGQDKADYSKGVLERFTRRAFENAPFFDGNGNRSGDAHVKIIVNPRFMRYMDSPHKAVYFDGKFVVNSNGECLLTFYNDPALYDKIVVNHYVIKSREEFLLKQKKGRADSYDDVNSAYFSANDRNEVFDDGILKYRAARAENFSFESDDARINRVINSMVRTLTKSSINDSLVDKLETFLTCRALAEKFQIKIGEHSAEELALAWIYRTLVKANSLTYAEIQQFLKALPEILTRPFPICKEIKTLMQEHIIPKLCKVLKDTADWSAHFDLVYVQKLLLLIK
ncbi:MAG: glycosyltransferase family 92 protein [Selenomonadaceae bacterium]|nr:glycosyltransferase family 92 protein [Selenomonadaceae bacterium]